jgi:hypothetical protein
MGHGQNGGGLPEDHPLRGRPPAIGLNHEMADSAPPRSSGRLPEVVIIGAAKSATTSLFYRLMSHSSVYGGQEDIEVGAEITHNRDKEPCFFSDDENYAKGLEWYASHFDNARPDQICIDASTNYTRWPQLPHTAERLAEHIPNARLLYICRHPVDRAYSHYVHRHALELHPGEAFSKPFEEHVKGDPVCLDSSLYMQQIDRYLEHFPRSSLHVILTTDLKHHFHDTMADVCRFIGIDPAGITTEGQSAIAGNSFELHHASSTRAAITQSFGRIPMLGSVARRLPKRWKDLIYFFMKKSRYGRDVGDSFKPPRMTKEVRDHFLGHFKQPNADLAKFLDRDLSEWSS